MGDTAYMENKNVFSTSEANESLKAFALSLCRYIIKDPSILLDLEQRRKVPGNITWVDVYEQLQDQKTKDLFAHNVYKDSEEYDWSDIEKTYVIWGRFGWITDNTFVPFAFWDTRPESLKEADRLVLKNIDKKRFWEYREETRTVAKNKSLFDEACVCFDNRCYAACASLLLSMIDGELIRSKANVKIGNRKTGLKAGERIVAEMSKDDHYGLPGLFHLNLLNFEAFISTTFEHADGFNCEPNHLNRNFLQHGMSKRKVLKKDCIKLFIAYRNTLSFSRQYNADK